jgi:hypothetical protein
MQEKRGVLVMEKLSIIAPVDTKYPPGNQFDVCAKRGVGKVIAPSIPIKD